MLNLPSNTEINKKIPKKKFYENLSISSKLERIFIEQIDSIYWRNKIASNTVNVDEGANVTEIEFFEIKLRQKSLDIAVLQQIDKEIPYHIVYLLSYGDCYQLYIGYKEQSLSTSNTFKVNSYYKTNWLNENELANIVRVDGVNIDLIYENLVRQIAGDKLQEKDGCTSLKEQILKSEEKQKILKQIYRLEKQARSEKQPRRKFDMFQDIKKLKSIYKKLSEE